MEGYNHNVNSYEQGKTTGTDAPRLNKKGKRRDLGMSKLSVNIAPALPGVYPLLLVGFSTVLYHVCITTDHGADLNISLSLLEIVTLVTLAQPYSLTT